eukprot:comp11581_c0_seq1/m.6057 comp11581_c0_seq1/g.6057  ORF comp11581_c0_seq1/g.6057 comp11581_c0_seq1/m.6057 type:complete len:510 (-) comp11581_c0_seq1:547-2076(-)
MAFLGSNHEQCSSDSVLDLGSQKWWHRGKLGKHPSSTDVVELIMTPDVCTKKPETYSVSHVHTCTPAHARARSPLSLNMRRLMPSFSDRGHGRSTRGQAIQLDFTSAKNVYSQYERAVHSVAAELLSYYPNDAPCFVHSSSHEMESKLAPVTQSLAQDILEDSPKSTHENLKSTHGHLVQPLRVTLAQEERFLNPLRHEQQMTRRTRNHSKFNFSDSPLNSITLAEDSGTENEISFPQGAEKDTDLCRMRRSYSGELHEMCNDWECKKDVSNAPSNVNDTTTTSCGCGEFLTDLRVFMAREHSEETLDFLILVHEYRTAPSRRTREHIYKHFLANGSSHQVNLEDWAVKEVAESMSCLKHTPQPHAAPRRRNSVGQCMHFAGSEFVENLNEIEMESLHQAEQQPAQPWHTLATRLHMPNVTVTWHRVTVSSKGSQTPTRPRRNSHPITGSNRNAEKSEIDHMRLETCPKMEVHMSQKCVFNVCAATTTMLVVEGALGRFLSDKKKQSNT